MKTINNIDKNIVNPQENDNIPLTEGIMAIKRCIKHGYKIYCYDKNERTVYVYTEEVQPLKDCPDHIIADLIAGNENAYIVTSSKKVPEIDVLSQDEIRNLMNVLNTTE